MIGSKNTFAFIILLLLIACKKENRWDMIKRTGKEIKEERIVAHVKYFNFGKGKMNFYFTNSPTYKVEVEAGENLIDLIKTFVKGDTLYVTNENKCNWARSYKPQVNIYISTPDLRQVVEYGQGQLKSTNTLTGQFLSFETWSTCDIAIDINCDSLRTHLHNSASVTATGFAKTHYSSMWHNSTFWGDDLITESTEIYNNTTGNFYCHVNSELSAAMVLSGNIIYSGSPSIRIDNLGGIGKVLKK